MCVFVCVRMCVCACVRVCMHVCVSHHVCIKRQTTQFASPLLTTSNNDQRCVCILARAYCHVHIGTCILARAYCHVHIVTCILARAYCHVHIGTCVIAYTHMHALSRVSMHAHTAGIITFPFFSTHLDAKFIMEHIYVCMILLLIN